MFFFSLVNYDDWHFQDNSDPARHKKDLPILTIVASPRWSFTEIANLNMEFFCLSSAHNYILKKNNDMIQNEKSKDRFLEISV